jgi:hypothetical protein
MQKNGSEHWLLGKTTFFRRKLIEIAKNSDQNIGPWLLEISSFYYNTSQESNSTSSNEEDVDPKR